MSHPYLGALLLAAGASRRLGYPKQLLNWEGEAMVTRQARLLLALQPACVVVVTGFAREEVERALAGLDVQLVHNAQWESGMGTSLACGIRAMPERVRGALLMLCDLWKLSEMDLERLATGWQSMPQKAVTAAWDGQSGPPVIFPRALFQRLGRLSGEQGARQVLRGFAGGVARVDLPNAAFDLDVESDLPDTIAKGRNGTGPERNGSVKATRSET